MTPQVWLLAGAFALGSAAGGGAAWHLGRAPLRMENADLREAHAEAVRLAVTAAAQRVQAAQTRSDTLGAQLAAQLATNATLTQEKTRALQLATNGRACLTGRALRVLNGSPGVSVTAAGVPAPGARAAATDAAPAAPEGAEPPGIEATDTAVALWIATAGEQYEACRERLNALIAWHTPAAPAPATKSPDEGHRP